ncbi:MAG: hypothetical protein JOZ29_08900 [Deltaproteobacteria bacterium]|nr:hypothetical protein [Deltaproteobacteria bacterium]
MMDDVDEMPPAQAPRVQASEAGAKGSNGTIFCGADRGIIARLPGALTEPAVRSLAAHAGRRFKLMPGSRALPWAGVLPYINK